MAAVVAECETCFTEGVSKKQKHSVKRQIEIIDELIASFTATKASLREKKETVDEALHRLQAETKKGQDESTQLHKDCQAETANLSKVVDANFQTLSPYMEWEGDEKTLDTVVAHHLFQQGDLDIYNAFLEESGQAASQEFTDAFSEIFNCLESLHNKDTGPALTWCTEHQKTLTQLPHSENLTSVIFQLHKLHFLTLLQQGQRNNAVAYIKTHITPLCTQSKSVVYRSEIGSLSSCLLWSGRMETSPYRHLLTDDLWSTACTSFRLVACAALQVPKDSHLSVCVKAGYLLLPTLMKYLSIRHKFGTASGAELQMPDFGSEFQFRSTFVCPVIQQISTSNNPPMLLPCYHVISRSALQSLMRSNHRLKCPYCPTECLAEKCKQLHL
eukprot:TRINITY_DN59349_c0_g1_i1.p1 TRINITY_DN59349_c0_g1~~TRINITY_DN59349_c0_g1_i1.p1  ORF type:complete len:400 (-),score=48.48 TRINITY_DN59349_c0_g1_i1:381-1538(-)